MTKNAPNEIATTTNASIPGWFMGIVSLPILLGLLWFGQGFLIPLVIMALLVILISAMTQRIDSATILGWKPPPWLAYLVSFGIVIALSLVIGAAVSGQAAEITAAAPRYIERANALVTKIQDIIGTAAMQSIQDAIAKIDLGAFVSKALDQASGLVGTTGLVLAYVVFLLLERTEFLNKLPKVFSTEAEAAQFSRVLRRISNGVQQYMLINTITSAMSGFAAYIVLKLVGVDFAVTLALMVFLLSFIPNIGGILATAIPTLLALIQFDTMTPALMVLVFYGGSDAIIGNVVQPRLQGKSLNMSTFMVMVALTFWGTMWGAVGAFMAVPMMVVTMIICAEIPALRPFAVLLSGDGNLDTAEAEAATPAPGKSQADPPDPPQGQGPTTNPSQVAEGVSD